MNKQHPILLFVILALLATAPFSSAQAQQPSEEQLARILKRFPDADSDKDGKLNTEEIQQFLKSRQRRNRRPAAAAEPTHAGDAVQGKGKASVEAPTVGTGEVAAKWKTTGFQQANSMGGGEAAISKSGKLRVFILMGQSNMNGSGRATELESPHNQKHDRIRIWANGGWEYLVPSNKFGPGVSLAHQLADFWPDDTIGIIKVSCGATGISAFEKNWSFERAERSKDGKKGALYKDLMNAVAEAK
ncbi:MAG: hypothetical protein GY878_22020 [Fuerstiella sp.]|nr:hypothetical protein [Fuerstiella sp.]